MPPVVPILLFFKGLPWRAIGIVVLALALAGVGWTVNGWRWEARWNERESAIATATLKRQQELDEQEQVLIAAFAMKDADFTAKLRGLEDENDRLRAGVDAGAVRLFVRAACPAAGLPQAAARAGLGDGARAELAADARPAYFALRDGLTRLETKLAACQDMLTICQRGAP